MLSEWISKVEKDEEVEHNGEKDQDGRRAKRRSNVAMKD